MSYALATVPEPQVDVLNTLGRMIQYRRPAGSKTERRFISEFIRPLGVDQDEAGNLYCQVGKSNVMWSCHTDTVHHQGGIQKVHVFHDELMLSKQESNSTCLGADDTAGVWLMTEMIKAGKPGLYVFHRAEEVGGVGSKHIAKNTPGVLAGIDIAIALDRKGFTSVITHQGTRCCSDAFGDQLAGALGLGFKRDSGGVFTDTANYTHLVPECTNLSVGYEGAHSPRETLDILFLMDLLNSLLCLDTSKLKPSRDPIKDHDDPWAEWDYGYDFKSTSKIHYMNHNEDYGTAYGAEPDLNMVDLIKTYPEAIADVLEGFGIDTDALCEELFTRGVPVPSNRWQKRWQ